MGVDQAQLVLVDPYDSVEAEDEIRFPGLREQNHLFAEKFPSYLVDPAKTLVATWSPDEPVMAQYLGLKRVSTAQQLAEASRSKTLVYFGFHYGRCILRMPAGASAMSDLGFHCSVLRDYSMLFPADEWGAVDRSTLRTGARIL